MALDVMLDVGLGLDEYDKMCRIQSSLYPTHLWTPSWLRSTYNDGGFNAVMSAVVGKDLWDVFKATEYGCYSIQPNWDDSLKVAQEIQQGLQRVARENPYYATSVSVNDQAIVATGVTQEREAIELFLKERANGGLPIKVGDKTEYIKSYMGLSGDFYLDKPLEVAAIIPGRGFDDAPCVYVVHKFDPTWYLQACEILIKEFIPLGMQHKETARVVWDT